MTQLHAAAPSTAPPDRPPAPRRPPARALRGDRLVQWLFVAPAVVYLLAFFGYPVVQNLVTGFQDYDTSSLYTGDAPFNGLHNYAEVLTSGRFGKLVLNTAVFTVVSMVAQFAIGFALALFFVRRFPLNGLVRSLLLLPWLVPMVASATVWRWMLDQDNGVVNRVLEAAHLAPSGGVPWLSSVHVSLYAVTLVNIWVGIPFNLVILYSGLKEIPTEVYEAAALDGVSGFGRLRHITWPLLRPVVTVVVVLGFIYTVKVIDIILVVTGGGPADASSTLAVDAYQLSFKTFFFGQGAAMGNILILVSLVFAAVHLRLNRAAGLQEDAK
ncbi:MULTISPECIES: carbohydrate ABC transporter permease [unclassified Streptomyces]|uniref:carbohydrate ABC transporter permease n=1 Tax=unclassified Streptomyces TaxID=2593676 RepID=UPI0010107E9F|nr:sugar ABC transporter permease [Streptomyces sp. GZWMJZ-114]